MSVGICNESRKMSNTCWLSWKKTVFCISRLFSLQVDLHKKSKTRFYPNEKLSSSKSKNISNAYFSIKISLYRFEIEKLRSKLDVLKIFHLANQWIGRPGEKLARGENPTNLKWTPILRLKLKGKKTVLFT